MARVKASAVGVMMAAMIRIATKAWRRMVTTWANPALGATTLDDYANREYAELIRDYYIPRWLNFLSQ